MLNCTTLSRQKIVRVYLKYTVRAIKMGKPSVEDNPRVLHLLVQTTYGQITPCPVQTGVLQDQV